MSKRRAVGDLVYKLPGHGFIGEGCWCVIHEDGGADWCPANDDCSDPACYEWNTLHVYGRTKAEALERIRKGEKALGMACHVNECEMADEGP